MALINLNNLGKRINGKWALWNVDLEVGAGEILGVFGRSDSGKSMLAHILCGIEEPTDGLVVVGDGESDFKISVALSKPAYAPELTVYENLEMFAALWGVPRRRRPKEIAYLLEMFDLAERRSLRASELSSGALGRMELARALLADSPLLVIDSLLDNLDPGMLERVWEHLLNLRRDELKSAIVFTSNAKVAELCNRIAVLHRGKIGYLGRPDDFRRMGGEDMVVLGDVNSPLVRDRIEERFSVVIREQDGFLSFKVGNGERMVSDLLSEFGSEMSCVYLKRPTLDDALDVLAGGDLHVAAGIDERKSR